MKTVKALVRPVPAHLHASVEARFRRRPGSRLLTRAQGPLVLPRRGFLRVSAGVACAAVLPVAATQLAGCNDFTTEDFLKAVEVAKEIFKIIEEIYGSFFAENPSDKDANVEIASDLLTSAGNTVDSITCVAKLPARSGLQEISWCGGHHAEKAGTHRVNATEGGNEPVFSNDFKVV